ncbi:MAG TPA: DUF2834 domain-containing protein [Mycobacterium sp.]|nr:DUF2834 domain-containing protein [Mycobacterium sp.]
MTTTRKILCGIYAAIAAVALAATWAQNAAYFGQGAGFFKDFLLDLRVTPASRSITADILLFLLAAVIFMVVEARKIGVPYVWAYVVGSVLIAISVTFPLFLIARERKLAGTDQPDPKPLEVIGLTVFAAFIAAQVVFVSKG